MTTDTLAAGRAWPRLRVADWAATRDTLHMWTQIVGKVRLSRAPLLNHWWQVTLYVSPRGLTTGTIPDGNRLFDLEFDFIDHQLVIRTSDGGAQTVRLQAKPVAEFHHQTLWALNRLGVHPQIQAHPNEVDPAIPFAEDTQHNTYDPEAAHLFWGQLVQASRVIEDFRTHLTVQSARCTSSGAG